MSSSTEWLGPMLRPLGPLASGASLPRRPLSLGVSMPGPEFEEVVDCFYPGQATAYLVIMHPSLPLLLSSVNLYRRPGTVLEQQ